MKFGKIGTPFYLLMSDEFPRSTSLEKYREMYQKQVAEMDKVKILMKKYPTLKEKYKYVLDKIGNNAQILLFEIGLIEQQIKEAIL